MANPTNNPNNYTADELAAPQPWEFDAEQVVYEFMTAGGINSPQDVSALLGADPTGADCLAEILSEWVLWCDLDDLKRAMARFIAERPDMDGE
jgi:hypothetical protein